MTAQAQVDGWDAFVWTVLWTVGELVVVIVPGAMVAAAAPVAQAARYVGWFQLTQGAAATVGLFAGPALAGLGAGPFAWWCIGLGVLGCGSVLAARQLLQVSWRQPVGCPCGALFCVCGGNDTGCASPSVILTHSVRSNGPG